MWFVYILRCAGGSFYVGETGDATRFRAQRWTRRGTHLQASAGAVGLCRATCQSRVVPASRATVETMDAREEGGPRGRQSRLAQAVLRVSWHSSSVEPNTNADGPKSARRFRIGARRPFRSYGICRFSRAGLITLRRATMRLSGLDLLNAE